MTKPARIAGDSSSRYFFSFALRKLALESPGVAWGIAEGDVTGPMYAASEKNFFRVFASREVLDTFESSMRGDTSRIKFILLY